MTPNIATLLVLMALACVVLLTLVVVVILPVWTECRLEHSWGYCVLLVGG